MRSYIFVIRIHLLNYFTISDCEQLHELVENKVIFILEETYYQAAKKNYFRF
ncbi:MAG: hypothetical protein ACJAT4_003026 [Granulosicoccus sp.]|jgi:hypothetical protein